MNRFALAAVGVLMTLALPLAQAAGAAKPAVKSAAKPAAKPAAKKPAATAPAAAAGLATGAAAGAVVASTAAPAAPPAMTEQQTLAQWVQQGSFPCDEGKTVSIKASGSDGSFNLNVAGRSYAMIPRPTTTGAVRLEDRKGAIVWLQLGNKSMLMDQGAGRRIADGCVSAQQKVVADSLKDRPAGNDLLGDPKK
jgi:hypothetical protein